MIHSNCYFLQTTKKSQIQVISKGTEGREPLDSGEAPEGRVTRGGSQSWPSPSLGPADGNDQQSLGLCREDAGEWLSAFRENKI